MSEIINIIDHAPVFGMLLYLILRLEFLIKITLDRKNPSLEDTGDASEVIGKNIPGDFDPMRGLIVINALRQNGFKVTRV
jgi:hypothetical protein